MEADYQKREAKALQAIKKAIPSSLKPNMLPKSKGMFAELYEIDVIPDYYMACAIDGVGTKILLAEAMGIYDTVGIDLVAMSANDLATFSNMSPFLFIDYLAVEHNIEEQGLTGDIIKGIVKGLEQCDTSKIFRNSIKINFGKGETASVDELMSGVRPGYGFDLAGGMIGFVPKAVKIEVKPGQKIIALPSSGLHSNGYTDARLTLLNGDFESRPKFRKRYKGRFSLNDRFDNSTIGKILLEPTRIYVRQMAKVSKFRVIGINNTGYGLKNLNRLGSFEFNIHSPLDPQPIFQLIQNESQYSEEEMYGKFNMGMGFFIITDHPDEVLQTLKEGKIVGEVKKGNRTVLKNKIKYVGY